MISRGLGQRRLRQVHTWLAAAIGAQVFLWFASGLFMVAFDIERVRGDHLRAEVPPAFLPVTDVVPPEAALAAAGFPATDARLQMLRGAPVWIVEGEGRRALVGGFTALPLPAPDEAAIAEAAQAAYAGRGALIAVTLLDDAPSEAGASGPIWQATFGPEDRATLYLDPVTGEPGKIRTRLWRQFDFMWGLHIMDWSTRSNFNSWWIKATAAFAVLFTLTGFGILGTKAARQAGRRVRSTKPAAKATSE